ncbi:transferase [Syncephalis pseudoplumigaleata]|uniref:Transferase n=1 Tax=Syncephalis pseudoplumigaleata TaxID=1712513 RepID=A0A4P9YSE4_9FUNG|nr:transferase [Syncephalis pseudoplumigaleata]|eukprot:RKP22282.1 transferase [Syncephalis pseudoplumigaleata]
MTVTSRETWIVPGAGYAHQTYELSHADHFPAPFYPYKLFFYKNHASKPDFLPTDRLVAGLKTVLEHYPILYGRLALCDDGEYEVRPSTEGIPFIEAAAEEDFAAFEPDCPQHRITPDLRAITQPPSEHTPLLGIKLTRFANNSGAVICVSRSHYVADGYACVSFIRNWAAIVRGESRLPFLPSNDRRLLRLDPKPSEEEQRQFSQQQQKQHQPDYQPGSNASVNKGVIKETSWFSTIDALFMLVWRATVRARAIAKEQPLTHTIAVNMRDKYPELPPNYYGNAFDQLFFTMTAGDIVDSPLGKVAAMHRQSLLATKSHTMEQWLMQTIITGMTSLQERTASWLPYSDYIVTDWSKFGFYMVDFGEGRPTYCRRLVNRHRRLGCILDMPPASDGSPAGLEFSLGVDETSYDRFCNDKELLTYGTILG